jgi:hypothetical protein
MRYLMIIIFLLFVSLSLEAQKPDTGSVTLIEDSRIDILQAQYDSVQKIRLSNPVTKGIDGFRIQIFFDSGNYSGDRAKKIKDEFEVRYPGNFAYITWDAPNYKVRVGDFRTRLEAEGFMQQIMVDYPNVFVIKDKINYPPIY